MPLADKKRRHVRGDTLVGMRNERFLYSHGEAQGIFQALVALRGEPKRLNHPSIALLPQDTLAAPVVRAKVATPLDTTRAMARASTLLFSRRV